MQSSYGISTCTIPNTPYTSVFFIWILMNVGSFIKNLKFSIQFKFQRKCKQFYRLSLYIYLLIELTASLSIQKSRFISNNFTFIHKYNVHYTFHQLINLPLTYNRSIVCVFLYIYVYDVHNKVYIMQKQCL